MTKIVGTPEGRPGIWMVTPEVAAAVIDAAPGETVHNYIGHGAIMIGANWEKDGAKSFVHESDKRSALVFPPQKAMRHQLVVINDEKRWAFDVGVIGESRMEVATPSPSASASIPRSR